MKKILFALAIVFMMSVAANAQGGHDGFIMGDNSSARWGDEGTTMPGLPHGGIGVENADQPAPIGNGLLILAAIGGAYALKRKK